MATAKKSSKTGGAAKSKPAVTTKERPRRRAAGRQATASKVVTLDLSRTAPVCDPGSQELNSEFIDNIDDTDDYNDL